MPSPIEPVIGQWYFDRDKDQLIEVIHTDVEGGFIDIQDFEGNIEELDIARWQAGKFELAQAPEEWPEEWIEHDDVDSDAIKHSSRP